MARALDARSRASAAWTAALVLLFAVRASSAVERAFHFSGPPVDGPFQLFNALRRIAAGQRGGADFQFFHGIGVPYLHYPLFWLAGRDLFASELARQLIGVAAFPLVLVVFFFAFTRDWRKALALSVLAYVVAIALPLGAVTTPLVSMLGVRSALPAMFPAIWYMARTPRARTIASGAMLGVSLLLGTEQAIAIGVAFVVVSAVMGWWSTDRRASARECLGALGIGCLVVVILLLVIGGSAAVAGALRYNLKLVPGDQYWYFGVPASAFAPDWASVFVMMRQMPRIPVAILASCTAVVLLLRRARHAPNDDERRRQAALAMAALYGLISCASIFGIFYDTYVEPCLRMLLVIGALELDRVLAQRAPRRGFGVVCAAAILWMVIGVPSTVGAAFVTLPHVLRAHVFGHEPHTLEDIWPRTLAEGQRLVDAHRAPNGSPPLIWSTYAGLIEADNGVFNPTSFDYLMHALGPANRDAYLDRFRRTRPALVQTVLPSTLKSEIWMEQTSWDFYLELLRDYRAIGGTPWSIYWERRDTATAAPAQIWSATLAPHASQVTLPVAAQFHGDTNYLLLDVRLDYRVHNPIRAIPFVGASPRYFVSLDNAVSRLPVTLDPYTTSARFPVIAQRGREPSLRIATYSLIPGPWLEVTSVGVSTVPVDRGNAGWLSNLIEAQRHRDPPGPGGDTTGRYRWR